MRSALIATLLVAPLTAVLTVGATVAALRALRVEPRPATPAPLQAPPTVTAVAPVVEPNEAPPRAGACAVDFLKLSHDLDRVSTALERFNQKLLLALGVQEPASPDADLSTVVSLDKRETPQ